MICEAYGYVERGLWDPPQKTTHRKLCDLLCGGEHVSIAVHVHNMSPQSFSKIMRRRGKAQLNVSTSWTFSTSGRKDSQAFRTFQDAVQFGDRWRTLSIKEDTKDAVDFVLHHCQSVLTQVRGLYIRGEFEDESKETKSWPILASTSSHIPSMRVAKVPLGCVAYSRCLFQHLTSLCVRLPEKLDQPENLVDCLRNLARLKRLTLLASARFDLGSYRTGKVASMPSLEELELMFDDLDMDVLTCMLSCISCQNVRKYIAHFDPLFEHYEDSGSSYDETQKSRDFALNLWSFLGERFPALEDITLGMQDRFSWDEEFMSILTEPLDAGRWLFSRLSSLTFHLGEGKTEQQLKCSTLLRLAVARAQEENISDIHSVTIYGLSDMEVWLERSEFDAVRFYIPNLYIERTDYRSSWTEGWLFG
ncbi:hypothetical protein BD410DRAFT_794890 [Rickenella mellea]|uniref:Uncharacterized protein n=1 Tax=Rickenella mellea TaxID=50990 RepID=A0A4Y7PQN1_9AGAM|nr:hypothetical protein BD410DRAFT_794890 [Rickenella mellea]